MAQVAVAQDDPAHVYASARSGLFASVNGGETWYGLSHGAARVLEGVVIAVDPQDSAHILATLIDGGPNPKASRDGGQTWYDVDTGMWGPGRPPQGDLVTQIVFASSEALVYAAVGGLECRRVAECEGVPGRGVIVSRDGGETWSQGGLSSGNVVGMAVSPHDSSLIYVAVHGEGIYRSNDAGQAWELVNSNPVPPGTGTHVVDPDLLRPSLATLAVDPVNSDKLYAGVFLGGVLISRDGGVTWEPSSAGMPPEASIRAFAVDPTNPDVVYAAALDSGVYVSRDGGQTWTTLNDGLLTRASKDLAISADGSVLYLATEGGGVFRLGTPSESLPQEPPPPTSTTEAVAAPTSSLAERGGVCGGTTALPLALTAFFCISGIPVVGRRRRR